MQIRLKNEKTDKIFTKTLIGKDISWFYDMPEEYDIFFDELEEKYNCALDFSGGQDFIGWSIYEIDDESLFSIILDEIFEFLKNPELWWNVRKYNL